MPALYLIIILIAGGLAVLLSGLFGDKTYNVATKIVKTFTEESKEEKEKKNKHE